MNIKFQKPVIRMGLLALLLIMLGLTLTTARAANQSLTIVYKTNGVIRSPSLVLDSKGNPVIAFSARKELRLVHCNDPKCEGGDEIVSIPYPGPVKSNIELVLDKYDNPVIAYRVPTVTKPRLIVIHCNDPYCEGTDEAYNYFDLNDNHGSSLSLVLDAQGYPVISYMDDENEHLKLVHCNDPNCNGFDENIHFVDVGGSVGFNSSLALDEEGYPVISYFDETNDDLKLAHCNDPNCEGGDESTTFFDIDNFSDSWFTIWPMVLDRNGYPVIAGKEMLIHCNDPNCVGGDESITSHNLPGNFTGKTGGRMVLDSHGHPILIAGSFSIGHHLALELMHCNDPNCEGGDENVICFTCYLTNGNNPTMALDDKGNPVISFIRIPDGISELMLMHCSDPNCTPNQEPDCSQAIPSMEFLWPLDHDFKPIDILGVTDPDGDDVTIEILGIYQDEPVTSPPSDPTHPDGMGVGTSTAQVRAEFSNPNGRVYTIIFRAEDGYNPYFDYCIGEVKVHALGFDIYAIEDQWEYDSTESP